MDTPDLVVEEQAGAASCFWSVVRERRSQPVSMTLVGMLAQAVTGTPGHVNSMAAAVIFLDRFPLESMREGTSIGQRPWLGTGHLFDFVIVTPAFSKAAQSPCSHLQAMSLTLADAALQQMPDHLRRSTLIPHMHIRRGGQLNNDLFAIIAATAETRRSYWRYPFLDIEQRCGVERLLDMMSEFNLSSLDTLANIFWMLAYRHAPCDRGSAGRDLQSEMTIDGYENPIVIQPGFINGDSCIVDFVGSFASIRVRDQFAKML